MKNKTIFFIFSDPLKKNFVSNLKQRYSIVKLTHQRKEKYFKFYCENNKKNSKKYGLPSETA